MIFRPTAHIIRSKEKDLLQYPGSPDSADFQIHGASSDFQILRTSSDSQS